MLGIMPQKKKISSVLLDDGGDVSQQPEVQEDNDIALDSVAEKFFKAIESKDKKMLIEALEDAFAMIGTGDNSDMGMMDGDIS